jgi:hypothetical protein
MTREKSGFSSAARGAFVDQAVLSEFAEGKSIRL